MHFTIVIQLVIENICTCVQGILEKLKIISFIIKTKAFLRGKEGKKGSQEIGIIIQVGKNKRNYIYIYLHCLA